MTKAVHAIRTTILLGLFLISHQDAWAQVVPPYKLTEIKIVNYNQYEHSFKDVTNEKDSEYWNALGLSVLASVKVTGKEGTYVSKRKVEISVYDGKKLILNRLGGIGYLRSGTFYVPAFLYGSFCQPVTIKARITGQKQVSTITKRLNFACGE